MPNPPSRRSAPDPDSSCFLTTATVETLGLPDDCEPLTLARYLRDEEMTSAHERAAVDLYYSVAPTIVARSTDDEFRRFWHDHMRDITTMIKHGEYDMAKESYTWATASLINRKATRYSDTEHVEDVYEFGLAGVGKDRIPYAVRFVALKLALAVGVAWHTTRLGLAKRRLATMLRA